MDSARPQHWNPEIYQRDAGFVATLGAPLLELLAPQSGEQVLDLGCGDGTLTLRLQEAGCEVLGVDSSPDQVAAARARGLRAEVVDGHALPFVDRFDAVFSNAALHWMLNPAAVLAGVARALKPGGRFVAEMGGAGNVDSVMVGGAFRKRGGRLLFPEAVLRQRKTQLVESAARILREGGYTPQALP